MLRYASIVPARALTRGTAGLWVRLLRQGPIRPDWPLHVLALSGAFEDRRLTMRSARVSGRRRWVPAAD